MKSRTIFLILLGISMAVIVAPLSANVNATPNIIRPIIDLNDDGSKQALNVETNPGKQSPLVNLLVDCPTGLIAYNDASVNQITTVCIVPDPDVGEGDEFKATLFNTLGQTLDVSINVDNPETGDSSSSSGDGDGGSDDSSGDSGSDDDSDEDDDDE